MSHIGHSVNRCPIRIFLLQQSHTSLLIVLFIIIIFYTATGFGEWPLSALENNLPLTILLLFLDLNIHCFINTTRSRIPLLLRCRSSLISGLDRSALSKFLLLSKKSKKPGTKTTFRSHCARSLKIKPLKIFIFRFLLWHLVGNIYADLSCLAYKKRV